MVKGATDTAANGAVTTAEELEEIGESINTIASDNLGNSAESSTVESEIDLGEDASLEDVCVLFTFNRKYNHEYDILSFIALHVGYGGIWPIKQQQSYMKIDDAFGKSYPYIEDVMFLNIAHYEYCNIRIFTFL